MFDKEQDKTRAIQRLQSVLQSARTTSNILLEVGRPKVMNTAGVWIEENCAGLWCSWGLVNGRGANNVSKRKNKAKEQKEKDKERAKLEKIAARVRAVVLNADKS